MYVAGWIKTNLFGIESNKHGFGIFAGLVDDEVVIATETFEGARFSYVEDVRNVYGAGVSYTYFVNGINQSGVTFGASIFGTNAKSTDKVRYMFQIGYQF